MRINGFNIEDEDMPSNLFYNRHKPEEYHYKDKTTGEYNREKRLSNYLKPINVISREKEKKGEKQGE